MDNKYYIVGPPGSGKTSLVRKIACSESFVTIELDDIVWKSGWTKRSSNETKLILQKIISNNDNIILEGCYIELIGFLEENGFRIVFLNTRLITCLKRTFKRTLKRIESKEKVCNGNEESLKKFFSFNGLFFYTIKTYFLLKKIQKNDKKSDVGRIGSHVAYRKIFGRFFNT